MPWSSSNAGRAASYLADELVSEGHEVTLFSSEDWETSAQLVRAQDFDIVHLHCDHLDLPSTADLGVPSVATVHAPCGIPDVRRTTSQYLSLYRSVIHANDCATVTVASCLRGKQVEK